MKVKKVLYWIANVFLPLSETKITAKACSKYFNFSSYKNKTTADHDNFEFSPNTLIHLIKIGLFKSGKRDKTSKEERLQKFEQVVQEESFTSKDLKSIRFEKALTAQVFLFLSLITLTVITWIDIAAYIYQSYFTDLAPRLIILNLSAFLIGFYFYIISTKNVYLYLLVKVKQIVSFEHYLTVKGFSYTFKTCMESKIWAFLIGMVILMSILAHKAFAISMDDIINAATNPHDLSRQALVMIFGNTINNPASSNTSFIGNLFFVFNSVLSSIAAFYMSYLGIRGVVNTGHLGKTFAEKGSMMKPVISVVGLVCTVPAAGGWSLTQLLILYAASIIGIGSANIAVDSATQFLNNGQSLVVQPTTQATITSAKSIFEMNLCLYGINHELSQVQSNTPYLMHVHQMKNGFNINNGTAYCGGAFIPKPSKSWKNYFNINTNDQELYQDKVNGLIQLQNTLNKDAFNFTNAYFKYIQTGQGTIPDPNEMIHEAASQYEQYMQPYINKLNDNGLQDALQQQIKKQGWISLGAWYQTFASANTKIEDDSSLTPTLIPTSTTGQIGAGVDLKGVMAEYHTLMNKSNYTGTLGNKGSASDVSSFITKYVGSPFQKVTDAITRFNFGESGNQMNPLIQMKTIGDVTLDVSETSLAGFVSAYSISSAMSNSGVLNSIADVFTFGSSGLAEGIITAVQPIIYFICFMGISIGFMLAIYLPFIPFIYWISAIANWLISVIVGCIAAPLWSITHVNGESSGNSAYGYIFLIDVMIRPLLMVFGFFFAGTAVVAMGTLLNSLFAVAFANVQTDSTTGLVTMIGVLLIYARICTTMVSTIFSLQVKLPDYVISWIGGRQTESILGDMVGETKSIMAGFVSKTGQVNMHHIKPEDEKDSSKNSIK